MKRLHVNLKVNDLEGSIDFYTRLFGSVPTVRKPDYARWMLADPTVNFAIGVTGGAAGVEHLGIQAETRRELDELRERARGAGGTVADEGETVCCYAHSDKSWVTDAEGVVWEMFYTHGSSDSYHQAPDGATDEERGTVCCAPECCTSASREQAS